MASHIPVGLEFGRKFDKHAQITNNSVVIFPTKILKIYIHLR